MGATNFIRTPMLLRKACVRDSVLLISREKISLPAMAVKGVSAPNACAIPEGGDTVSMVIKPRWQFGLPTTHPWQWPSFLFLVVQL